MVLLAVPHGSEELEAGVAETRERPAEIAAREGAFLLRRAPALWDLRGRRLTSMGHCLQSRCVLYSIKNTVGDELPDTRRRARSQRRAARLMFERDRSARLLALSMHILGKV